MNFTEYEQKLLDTKPRFLTDEEKIIRKKCKTKIKNKKSYQKNKEKFKESYQKNKEKFKEKSKKYKIENKDKIKEDYQKNRDTILENKKEYYQKNRDTILENKKEYIQTPEGKKSSTKKSWKKMGLNMENFESIYKRYCQTTNCDNCGVLLTKHRENNNTFKVMDHEHSTGEFRNVLCHLCNVRRG